ncbi:MAG: DUF5652 family protein [Candidatus Woesearchaeota archaeon]
MNQTILSQGIMPYNALLPNLYLVLILISVWELILKGIALWKSARNKHLVWFACILIFNTLGILPIIYLAFFSQKKKNPAKIRTANKKIKTA